ncbi:hypothetical protein U9Y90_07805 [Escherichia coli]
MLNAIRDGVKRWMAIDLASKDNESLDNTDAVVWMTTGTTHVARAEEWPIMPTEWVHTLLKPWNFFDETPTLGALKKDK